MKKLPKEYLEEFYPTKDIYLASSLIAFGYHVIEITQEGKQFTFHLDKQIDSNNDANYSIEDVVEAYWAGKLSLDPKKLWGAYREIKGRMYRQ